MRKISRHGMANLNLSKIKNASKALQECKSSGNHLMKIGSSILELADQCPPQNNVIRQGVFRVIKTTQELLSSRHLLSNVRKLTPESGYGNW